VSRSAYASNQVGAVAARDVLDRLDATFRPSAPVSSPALLSGRDSEHAAVLEAVRAPGRHVVVHGEAGVGTTSLAASCAASAGADGAVALVVACPEGAGFDSIWRSFAEECAVHLADRPDHGEELEMALGRANAALDRAAIGPGDARVALHHVLTAGPAMVVLDGFDRVGPDAAAGTTDLIGALSRRAEPVTLVVAGATDGGGTLLEVPPTVERALVRVHVPRLATEALAAIARDGLASLGMDATGDVFELLETASLGLPRYAHVVARAGARRALQRRSLGITVDDVAGGLRTGLVEADPGLDAAYRLATTTARPSRFADVLLACALTPVDGSGTFAPAAMRDAYSFVTGRVMDIPNFNPQLAMLAEGRGAVLARTGGGWRRRYRFRRPEMAPYVLLSAIADGRIAPGDLRGHIVGPARSGRLFDLPSDAPDVPRGTSAD